MKVSTSKIAVVLICMSIVILILGGCSDKNPYTGTWKVTGAYGSYSGTQIDATWTASGTVKVTSDHITVNATVDGEEFKEEGTFETYMPQGRVGYIASSGLLMGIGESNGKYILAFSSGDISDGALGFYLERS